jgi:hypothetical protein
MSKTKTNNANGSSTLSAMNDRLASMTAAGQSSSKPSRRPAAPAQSTRTISRGKKTRVGRGTDAITYRDGLIRVTDKKTKQTHTREEVTERIDALRKRIGGLYANGKFSSSSLGVVMTSVDNITFLKCSGEFDRAMDLAADLDDRIDNA